MNGLKSFKFELIYEEIVLWVNRDKFIAKYFFAFGEIKYIL